MPYSNSKFSSPKAIRVATLLLPPLGLVLLWRSSRMACPAKWLGTFYIFAFSILYLIGVVGILAWAFKIDLIQWRKGYQPVLALSKRLLNDSASTAVPSQSSQTNAPWSAFRGADRDGIYHGPALLTNWPSAGLHQLWRHPVGSGYSSMAIAGGLVYTIEQRREKEVATAYDTETGREIWRHGWTAKFDEDFGGEGPRATPTYDDGHLYIQGATGDLICLTDSTGQLLWQRNILTDNQAKLTVYGLAASPLIVNDKVIVLPGGTNGRSIVAYDKLTGAPAWHSYSDPQAYTSPMLVDLAGEKQILVVSARNIIGLAPETGRVLWQIPWVIPNDNAIAQPVLLNSSRFLVSAGYGIGSTAFELTHTNHAFTVRELWHNHYLKNKFSSSVTANGYIYGLDETILTCLAANTGERQWKDGCYGYGQVLLAGNQIVVLAEDGTLALVEAIPNEFHEISRFQVLTGKTWNPPALANGKIFVRNAMEMACYDLNVPIAPRTYPHP